MLTYVLQSITDGTRILGHILKKKILLVVYHYAL